MFDAFVIIPPPLIPGDSLQKLKLREKQKKNGFTAHGMCVCVTIQINIDRKILQDCKNEGEQEEEKSLKN